MESMELLREEGLSSSVQYSLARGLRVEGLVF